ncbi:hypothetical protein N9C98_00340 [Synechococcus sp. AH-224-G16]|nr:hypothetical protein [Synechococcus sp. AH-224-G16]
MPGLRSPGGCSASRPAALRSAWAVPARVTSERPTHRTPLLSLSGAIMLGLRDVQQYGHGTHSGVGR